MSGRDFKLFLESHKMQIGQPDNHHLVMQAITGRKPLYKPVDYEKLEALVKIKHSSGEKALQRVNLLTKHNDDNKNERLLKEHRRLWHQEFDELKKIAEKLQKDLDAFVRPHSLTVAEYSPVYDDVIDFKYELERDCNAFVKYTLDPVNELRADVQNWLKENHDNLLVGAQASEREIGIKDVISDVKSQQTKVMEKLCDEQLNLENEMRETISEFKLNSDSTPKMFIGVPEFLINTYCPDEVLKEACLMEFNILDENYALGIEKLEQHYDHVINCEPFGGWSEEDCKRFLQITKQYNKLIQNKRTLFMDRLRREFPHKSKAKLLAYDKWCFEVRCFESSLRDLFASWARDREDLARHVKTLFEDACVEFERKIQARFEQTKQRFVCLALHERLRVYHEEMEELAQLEAEQRKLKEEEIKEEVEAAQQKEKSKREKQKQKVREYQQKKSRIEAGMKEIDRMRILELKGRRAHQNKLGEQRIIFRKQKYEEKLEEKQREEKQKQIKCENKEKLLQALRDQVAVHAERDPERLVAHTEATKARLASAYEEEREAQEPLFSINTFSVDQIASDKRLKVEAALRRANLHMNDYARSMIANVQPPTQPRKDNQSTVFQYE